MILGIGSDIIHIPRIARAIVNERFLQRVYTVRERAYAESRGKGGTASLAARAAEMGVTNVWITLSHERDYALAYCVLEGQR